MRSAAIAVRQTAGIPPSLELSFQVRLVSDTGSSCSLRIHSKPSFSLSPFRLLSSTSIASPHPTSAFNSPFLFNRYPRYTPLTSTLVRAASGGEGAGEEQGDGWGGEGEEGGAVLVLYSKAGCCLCDALKEKLQLILDAHAASSNPAAIASPIAGLQLEVRDICSNEDWFKLYEYEVPVMARLHRIPGGTSSEIVIPRQSPRVSVDRLQKALESAFGNI